MRQLIARLQDDEELGGLARIARHMMAAIHLPRAISDREDLPVGGVSDISNRGPLDRLLPSELAHDDLTLAVRIAMNEALYLRRETPPSNPPKHRAVLLDSGIRLWGVPRVFATAVGMALAAGTQRNVRTDVFARLATRWSPCRWPIARAWLPTWRRWSPTPIPGRSLAAFAATASAEAGLLDAVIVTGEDVAADHDFQRSLAALELPSVLLATVSREGRFRLVSQGRRGSKLLREATLDLEKLLARPARRRAPLIDPAVPAGLPAILSVRPFPLLLSYSAVRSRAGMESPVGWRSLDLQGSLPVPLANAGSRGAAAERSYSRRRVALDRRGRGGHRQPGGCRHVAAENAFGCCASVPRQTVRVFRPRSAGRPSVAVCGHAGTVFVIYRGPHRFVRIGRRHEDPVDARSAQVCQWQRDRFFRSDSQWYALSFDGFKPVFEPLLSKDLRPLAGKFLTFVDVPGVEGPVGIMDDGSLFRPGERRRTPVHHGLDAPVRSGGRLALGKCRRDLRRYRQEPPRSFAVVTATWRTVFGDPQLLARSASLRCLARSSGRRPCGIGSPRSSSIPRGGWGWFPANPSR